MKPNTCLAGLLAAAFHCSALAAPLLTEGFEDVAALSGRGWLQVNVSWPPGSTGWFQGDPGVFAAAGGPDDAYIAANFTGAAYGGMLSNWLLTPQLSLLNGAALNFSLRLLGDGVTDQVDVYYAVGGVYTLLDSYASATDTGWRQHTLMVRDLTAPAIGRFAFRYGADDTSLAANYIGIDEVSVNLLPEPATFALVMLGLLALQPRRRWLAALGLAGAAITAQAGVPAPPPRTDGVMQFPHVQLLQQPPAQAAPGQAGGLMAYKDPLTGRLTSPDAEQAAALTAQQRSVTPLARQAAPTLDQPPHGGVSLMLDQRQVRYATARKDADGRITESCGPAAGEQK